MFDHALGDGILMLRVGLAGTGAWARRTHLPALAGHAGVELAGIWGRDRDRTRRLAEEFGTEAFDTFETLVGAVDIVDLALPPAVQVGFALPAASAGRHLLLEKPVSMRRDEANALARTVAERQVLARVFLSRLFDAQRRHWLEDSAALEWRSAAFSWKSAGLLGLSPAADGWRTEAGPLFDVGPHVITQLEFLLGTVTDVRSAVADARGAIELSLLHDGGATSASHIDLRVDVPYTEERIALESAEGPRSWSNEGAMDFVGAFRLVIDDLVGELAGDRPADEAITRLSTAADGARMVWLLEAIAASLGRAEDE